MSSISVLLVDDEQRLLNSLSRQLNDLGYEVSTAVSAEEARVILNEETFQVVVSDYMMQGTTGLAFLNELKMERPELGRILLSGSVTWSQGKEVKLRDIAHVVLEKPCKVEDLDKAILKCAEAKAAPQPESKKSGWLGAFGFSTPSEVR